MYNAAFGNTYTVTVDLSSISGTTAAFLNDVEFNTFVGNSLLDGSVLNTGSVTSVYVHDENYAMYVCP